MTLEWIIIIGLIVAQLATWIGIFILKSDSVSLEQNLRWMLVDIRNIKKRMDS